MRLNYHYCLSAPDLQLVTFYTSWSTSILEYACQVWHSGLTVAQSDTLESVQKRALRIIYAEGINSDYQILLIIAGIDTLKYRREVLCESFLRDMFYLLAHYFIIYFLIAVIMTLLAA